MKEFSPVKEALKTVGVMALLACGMVAAFAFGICACHFLIVPLMDWLHRHPVSF